MINYELYYAIATEGVPPNKLVSQLVKLLQQDLSHLQLCGTPWWLLTDVKVKDTSKGNLR